MVYNILKEASSSHNLFQGLSILPGAGSSRKYSFQMSFRNFLQKLKYLTLKIKISTKWYKGEL